MTVVRRKPTKRVQSVTPEPWPTARVLEPRVTTKGKVTMMPSPIQSLWAEAEGRTLAGLDEQAEGLCVAISILWGQTLEDVRDELAERVSRRSGQSARRGG